MEFCEIKDNKYWELFEIFFLFANSVANKERPPSPAKNEKAASGTSSKAKAKGKDKDKGSKEKAHGSRPPSQQFDLTKPNWTLRIVSDGIASVSPIY